ncbi:glycosyltransferase [Gordonia rubripertincta]|uniref:4,4'-diaponeurosporenoate glycosyltransferase n=1 Tax=Gordonia rubripertincta TaxID=36822 RepID=A0ABT4N298_GORRU|nr:glycosyltransferase family 2 protein [Gordonia rubripertincta]MCZ4553352.1 glycosyltransferase family 2 protein [Gordonia rubripertincta]
MTTLRLSVVVPAYNEAEALRGCLDSLLGQISVIDEVVVVDNNSTDDTATVVEEFTLIDEKFRRVEAKQQGVMFARTVGFDSARGELMARIDADARVNPSWAQAILDFFAAHGDTYEAGVGMCTSYDLPFQERFRRAHRELTEQTRMKLAAGEPADTPRLFGSNMVITKAAWEAARPMSSMRTDVFEDLDLTLCVERNDVRIGLIPGADATISGRRYLTAVGSYFRYCMRDQRTFKVHGLSDRRRKAIIQMMLVAMPFYLLHWIPFRAYDPQTESFSLRMLRQPAENRPTPRAHR